MNYYILSDLLKIYYKIIEALNTIDNIYFILVSFLFLILTAIILSYRFQIITNKINKENSLVTSNISEYKTTKNADNKLIYREALLFTTLGGIANIGGIGKLGIPTKAILLKKQGYSVKTSIASIALDTFFDIIFSVLILIFAAFYFPSIKIIDTLDVRIIIILLIIILSIAIIIKNKKWYSKFFKNIGKMDNRTILELFAITSIAWILTSISYYFIIISTNENVDVLTVFIIFTLSVVIGIISPIAGGIGVREGMLTFLSATINIAPSKGLLIAIIHRVLSIVSLLFILMILKLNKKNTETIISVNDYASEKKRELKAKKIRLILQKHINFTDKIILEIGCGYGYVINQFQKISGHAIGIDKSYYLVKSSKKNHGECEFICADGTLLPIKKNSADLIILNHVIEHTDHKDELIKECNRILKEKGIIYIATPNKHFLIDPHTKIPFFGYMGRKIHDRFNIHNPTKKELIELLEQNSFSYNYLSTDIINNLTDFEEYNTFLYKLISKFSRLLTTNDFLMPTHVFIAKKLHN